jgi:hypothetical protein
MGWAECVTVEGGAVRTYFRPAMERPPSPRARGAWCSNSYQARLSTATREIAVSLIDVLRVVAVRTARRSEFLFVVQPFADSFLMMYIKLAQR